MFQKYPVTMSKRRPLQCKPCPFLVGFGSITVCTLEKTVKLDDIQLHSSIVVKTFVVFNSTDLNAIVGKDEAAKDDNQSSFEIPGSYWCCIFDRGQIMPDLKDGPGTV